VSRVITQQVVVRVTVSGAANVNTQLQNAGRNGQDAFSGMNAAIATATKALISMGVIMVAFNVFVTLPEKIAGAFRDLAITAIKSADDMQRQIFNTAGLLTSFASFGPTLSDSFAVATKASEKMMMKFAELASTSVASATDIGLAFQTFVARGGLSFVKNMDEAAQTAALLTNIVVSLTGGLQKERQIVSEISALMSGQATTGNVMAKIIKAQVGDLNAWLEKQKQAGTLLESLRTMFQGIDEASKSLGGTAEGMISSIAGNLAILNRIVMQTGSGFQIVTDFLRYWRDLLSKAVSDIANIKGGFDSLAPSTQAILTSMMEFGISIEQILKGVFALVEALFGTNNQLSMMTKLSNMILSVTVLIRSVLEQIANSTLVKISKQVAEVAFVLVSLNLAQHGMLTTFSTDAHEVNDELATMQWFLGKQFEVLSRSGTEWLKVFNVGGADEKALKRVNDFVKELRHKMEQDVASSINAAAVAWAKYRDGVEDAIEKTKGFPKQTAEALAILKTHLQVDLAQAMIKDFQDVEKVLDHMGVFLNKIVNLPIQELLPPPPKDQAFFLHDVLNSAQIAHDEITVLLQDFKMFNGTFTDLTEASKRITREMKDLTAARAAQQTDSDEYKKLSDKLRILASDQRRVNQEMLQFIFNGRGMQDVMRELIIRVFVLGQSFREVFQELLPHVLNALSDAWTSMFESMTHHMENQVSLIKRMAAGLIGILADVLVAVGKQLLVLGVAHMIFGDFGRGAALLAAGAGALAAAGLLRGVAGNLTSANSAATTTGGVNGSSTPGNRTIFLTPRDGSNGLAASVDRLSEQLDRLDTVSPGVVVMDGTKDPRAMRQIAAVTEKTLQTSPSVRARLAVTMSGAS